MLTRRTNVLLTEEDYLLLKQLSRDRRLTIGSLVREAVNELHGKEEKPSLKELLEKTRRIGCKAGVRPEELKGLINEGRKS